MPSPASFLPQELIRRKRDGEELPPEAINAFVRGLLDGSVSEGQVAAFAMAVHFRGMTMAECVALTQAMTLSGERLRWEDAGLGGPVLDKHSTGGVGDKVSLILAPLLAACGAHVPMISGRGLGHTGGTLDKLESIPGYDVTPDVGDFRRIVADVGCAIVGQTGRLAPADDRFYAIRDVTATVDPIPLITASILSKKLAAGLGALVMDVKVGSGAFSRSLPDAAELAEHIATVATGAGLPTRALITDMNEVLGPAAGNALEVVESIDFLTGAARDARLLALVRALGATLLDMSGAAADEADALSKLDAALDGGAAAERFARMAAALGGPTDLLERTDAHLPRAPVVRPVPPERAGFVEALDVRAIGMAVVDLGGGRRTPGDRVDPRVGFGDVLGLGAETGAERPLAMVHAADEAGAARAAEALRAAVRIGDAPPATRPVVHARLGTVHA